MRRADRIVAPAGVVTLEARDAVGRLVERRQFRNAYTLLGATEHAKALAGETASLALTDVGLGAGGVTLADCESTAGWTGSPVLDAGTFRQGQASLRREVAASTSAVLARPDIFAGWNADAAGMTDLQIWLRLFARGSTDLAATELRVYTGAGTANFFWVNLSTIEFIAGVPFVDGIWRHCLIPRASFVVGAGAPSWAAVTGFGVVVAATAAGSASLWWDGVRAMTPIDVTGAATAVPNEPTRRSLTTLSRTGRAVTADAFWGTAEAIDQYHVAGLYAGSVLVSVLPFAYYKPRDQTLRLTWTLTTLGG